jgi:multicomponent K+:H+ antiporter subunit G
MTVIAEYVAAGLLVVSGLFGLIGSFGLLKLRDTMQRLHAPTKATTVGVGAALIASMIAATFIDGSFSWHELLITLFLLLTAPITANFIAKAQMHRHIAEPDIPATGVNRQWATYEDDAARDRQGPDR